jgi:hypothetical protein
MWQPERVKETRLKIQHTVQISIISKYTLFNLLKYWINGKQWFACTSLAFTINIKNFGFYNNKLLEGSMSCWCTTLQITNVLCSFTRNTEKQNYNSHIQSLKYLQWLYSSSKSHIATFNWYCHSSPCLFHAFAVHVVLHVLLKTIHLLPCWLK